jgi:hypothetical protein
MTIEEEIKQWLGDDAVVPTADRVEKLATLYPAFTLPARLLLQRGGDAIDESIRQKLLNRIALNSADAEALRDIVDPMGKELDHFYPANKPTPVNTDTTIDKFLDTYGTHDANEDEVLTRLIFNPTPDYAQLLAREEEASVPAANEAPDGSQDSLINEFIIKSRAQYGHFPSTESAEEATVADSKPLSPVSNPETTDDSLLSESLAKVYIRQHRYAKAFEIIEGLSLNFPEKSIYFADQLRFLQKLMLIEKLKAQS